MASDISEGSIVQLKSGGPAMTVRWVGEDFGGTIVANCDWFIQDKAPWKKENDSFPLPSLRILES